jgi:hypothetical protein
VLAAPAAPGVKAVKGKKTPKGQIVTYTNQPHKGA